MTKKRKITSVRIPAFLFLLLTRYTKEGERTLENFLERVLYPLHLCSPCSALAAFFSKSGDPISQHPNKLYKMLWMRLPQRKRIQNHKSTKMVFHWRNMQRSQKSDFSCCHWRKIMSGSSRYKWMNQKSLRYKMSIQRQPRIQWVIIASELYQGNLWNISRILTSIQLNAMDWKIMKNTCTYCNLFLWHEVES